MEIGDEGVVTAFEVVAEVSERCVSVCSLKWLADILPTVSRLPDGQATASSILAQRLNYLVGTQTNTITHFDTWVVQIYVYQPFLMRHSPMYLLGYNPAQNKIYLVDKDVNVYAYGLSLVVVEYQTAVLRGGMDAASSLLAEIPAKPKNKVTRFLEAQSKPLLTIFME